ncbi:putative transmembrane serine/threonine-protein kinase H PknH (protein kinase H) (STPK H) [Mycobacterium tuberculosis H37Rv] [Mycobacterium shimoidei]|uniref:Putative transmembrane serine/threonine-protein kinase H PknH (Protein kinase H) (STPK H) [Mycobacterium tuberculosis H37Rv] n=2 Tax=Mycobacterium shimoidei TaxID=29313 RepID=A0A375Z105_MYCSH|nr:putative transmembrane serine/threonine-protein kinase H PknH (protein kinase H) (STPK H) [Mycobacterium tuberculosis H37Rv] [Mycobacterium shimoidei]
MSRLIGAAAAASVCIVMTACSNGSDQDTAKSSTTTTTTFIPRPVVEREIDTFLLSPEQINPVMGTDKLAITKKHDTMSDDAATMQPRECLAIDGSAQAQVYADSGFTAVRDQALNDGDNFTHFAEQAVVLFPTAKQAGAFFAASAKQWPACHEYTHVQSGTKWKPGPVSNSNGVLSVVATQQDAKAPGWACGRALQLKNNVIVDVNTCSPDPKNSAVDLANQIAARIPAK